MPTIELSSPKGSRRASRRIPGRGQQPLAGQQGDRHDRHVHQEHRSPPEMLQQPPAGDRAESDREARDRSPDTDGLGPLCRHSEHVDEDGQCGREDQRRTDAHSGPGGDELAGVAGECGQDGGPGEDHETRLERPLAPETVAQAAGGE
jgi:hypothetical protein